MSIQYTYHIIKVDEAARCMEVAYSAQGFNPLHVGVRLPYLGESLESVVDMHAPTAYWNEQHTPVSSVSVGASGLIGQAKPDTLDSVKAFKRQEITAMRFALEVGGARFKGIPVHTDRQSKSALVLACLSIKEGLIQCVDWKTADGSFIVLNAGNVSELVSFFVSHAQMAFAMEKAFYERIDAATTIDEVKSIVWQ